jgi:hypothetical protein
MRYDNGENRRRNPITRNSMFMSQSDFDYEMMVGRNYVEQDMGQTIVLYEVDLEETKINDIYMDAAEGAIRFKPPVELPVVYELEDAELKQYDKTHQKGVYSKLGKLTFGVYEMTLVENECDIKRGDYIGLQVTPEKMEFFTVTDDGRINYSNKLSYYGRQPYYRKIVCAPVDKNEFNG